MAAYWIAHVTVTNAEEYQKYAALAKEAVQSRGGEFLALGSRTVWLEGEPRGRNVVVKFPTVEDAERCYWSDEYQAAMVFARGAAERDLCIVEGD